jgi:hypothetical protein
MQASSLAPTAKVILATLIAVFATEARAFDYRVAAPITHDNLAVYFVHGGGAAAAPATLEQALASGAAKVYETKSGSPEIENLSDRPIFIQLGDFLKGGLQDQVAGADLLLPPHSGRVSLDTYCVDPFRSTVRNGENPRTFSAAGALFPSRAARLAMLTGHQQSKPARELRQSAVWWSIDTVRFQLSQALGQRLETPRRVRWESKLDDEQNRQLLAGRRSDWTTSLPLALESRHLFQALVRSA